MNELTSEYWSSRYTSGATGWDLGAANHGLVDAVLRLCSPRDRILIPGAGRGHEARALWAAGHLETYVCDWSQEAFTSLRQAAIAELDTYPINQDFISQDWLDSRLLVSDFFDLAGRYDVIVEQTFFCAIDPSLRDDYVSKCAGLLSPAGHWIGVLFNREFPTAGPPFGGSEDAYRNQFEQHFRVLEWRPFEASVGPRQGAEWFGYLAVKQSGKG